LGVFDLVSVNGKVANQSYLWRLQELETWLQGGKLVHVLPYIQPKSYQEIFNFWKYWVEDRGFEGLFARDDRQDLYKLKPFLTIDCVVIGLNKRGSWKEKEVTSLKLALIDSDGAFIEIGDVASGIDRQLRASLYDRLMPLAKREHEGWVQIPPFIVAEVEATELFRCEKPRYLLKAGVLELDGSKRAYSLRHPRLIRFRSDKKATVEDAGYERQLPN
jgi:ATP-dependent DNA ligase